MNRVRLLLAIGTLALAAMPVGAAACDMPGRIDDPAAIDRHAREVIQRSIAIIDAEVVAPSGPDGTARLRPLRVLKGPALPVFLVATPSNCDVMYLRAGVRMRVVLSGGPDRFSASTSANGAGYTNDRARQRFFARLDALLGAPRPQGFVSPLQ